MKPAPGSEWVDKASGRRYRVHGVTGDGSFVSENPEIAEAQRSGPPMALLTEVGSTPHIFDWIGVGALERGFDKVAP